MSAPFPPPLREAARLAALYRYEVLDSPPEKELDDLVHLAAYICNTPISLISLVDSDRQWFKSKVGLAATQTSRIIAFCAHAILDDNLLIVPDTLADERFKNNPLVTGDPHVRFYCGAPLITPDGYRIGVLNVIDHVPRELSEEQLEAVRVLSRQVMDHLTLDREHRELIQAVNERTHVEEELKRNEEKFRALSDTTSSGIYIYSGDRILFANPAATTITGYRLDELLALSFWDLIHPAFRTQLQTRVQAFERGEDVPAQVDFQIVRKDGAVRWISFTSASIEYEGQAARIGTAFDISEHKQALIETFDRERLLQTIYDSEPECVKLVDSQGQLLSMNRAGLDMLEAGSLTEVQGQSIYPMVAEEHRQSFRALIEAVFQGESGSLEYEMVGLNGVRRFLETQACPLRDQAGEVQALLGITRDISYKRQAMEALRTSEARLHAILDNSPSMVFLKDRVGRYIFVNRMFEQRFDLPRDQVIGKTDNDLFSPKQATAFQMNDQTVFQTGLPSEFEEVANYEDGEHTSIVVKFPVRDGKKDIYAIGGFVTDITARKKMEKALRESEERFRLVASTTNDVLWDWNLVTNEAWESQNAHRLFGYDSAAKPSLDVWTSRLHPDDQARLRNSLDEAIQGQGESWSAEYRFRRADGSYGYFIDRGHIVRDAMGKPIRMIGAMVDVTGAKQAYQSLNAAYARLQTMSREVQAAEEKERQRLSRELHDEFGQLLSAVKFDLNKIREGLLNIRSPKAAGLRRTLLSTTGTVDRLFVSFREVLAALRPATLVVLGLVKSIQVIADEMQGRTGVRCRLVSHQDDIGALCGADVENTLYRSVQELLMNIEKHAKATATTITIACTNGWVTLTVKDDGVGFAAHQGPGEGRFGLRGIEERVEILGGSLSIRSEPGTGTAVTIRLPYASPAASEGAVTQGK
jgi:PAS domain S-box-containing protein